MFSVWIRPHRAGTTSCRSTWAGPTLTPIGPRAQFYRPWCTLTGELGPTEIAPNWAPRPILQSLVHIDWGIWTDRNCSKLGPKANSTVLGASWPGTWTDWNCSQLGPKANSSPWCKLTRNLDRPKLFPIEPRTS